jgi:hypothetical protein
MMMAGCGSTVSGHLETRAAGQVPGDNLGTSSTAGSLGSGGAATGAGSSGTLAGGSSTTGAAGNSATGAGGSVVGGTGSTGSAGSIGSAQASHSKTVQIGFLVTKCGNCNLLGSKYAQSGHSEQDVMQAFVNDQNSRGGVLGRKIVPVFATEDTASTDFSTMLQSICATFTQDHHVAAVVGAGFGYSDILGDCLTKASIPIIDAMRTTGVPDSQNFRTHPGYVVPGEPELDVYSLAAYTSAMADGWLTTKTKLGVLNYDCPGSVRVWKNVVKPYLDANHINVVDNYTANCLSGASDVGKAAQDVQQAELQMRANGADAIAITDVPLVVFAEDAESQHYYPKYLATEGGGATYESLLPASQASNVHAPGWEPSFDLDASHQLPLTAQQRTCLASLTHGGLSGQTASEHSAYFSLCGGWQLYLQAIGKAGDFTSSRLLDAINSLGSSFVSPFTLGGATSLGPNKHGAPVKYRTELYNSGCSCFQYSGPERALPSP